MNTEIDKKFTKQQKVIYISNAARSSSWDSPKIFFVWDSNQIGVQ